MPAIDIQTPPDLAALQAMASEAQVQKKAEVSPIRAKALQESGLSFGAQGGLSWRVSAINMELKRLERSMDKAFNFAPLMIKDNVLPPVIVGGQDSVKAESDGQSLRIADQMFKIEAPARFVTVTPTWRNYLLMDVPAKPEVPHPSVLPKDAAEQELWNSMLQKGWDSGVAQADAIFSANMARLRRDIEGMIRYRKLLAMNMVSEPIVASSNLGVTGDGQQVSIQDRIYRISVNPTLEMDAERWKAVVRKLSEK